MGGRVIPDEQRRESLSTCCKQDLPDHDLPAVPSCPSEPSSHRAGDPAELPARDAVCTGMIPFRVIRSGLLLAGLLATLSGPVFAAEGGFTASLSSEAFSAAGLPILSEMERAALDRLVAGDISRANLLKTSALPGKLSDRHNEAVLKEAGLNRLTAEQVTKLNELVDAAIYNRPQPKARPRLQDSEVLSEKGRLRVHGGFSFTYGWSGSRSFREVGGWVSYYDTVTGLGVSFGYSRGSGDGLYGYYPDYYYRGRSSAFMADMPSAIWADRPLEDNTDDRFRGDGASLRVPSASSRGRLGYLTH